MENETLLLNPRDLQALLGISRDSCYKLMNSKYFPSIKIGNKLYVSKVALDNWMINDKVRRY